MKHLYLNPITKKYEPFIDIIKMATAKTIINDKWHIVFGVIHKNPIIEWNNTNKAMVLPKDKMKLKCVQNLPDVTGVFEKEESRF